MTTFKLMNQQKSHTVKEAIKKLESYCSYQDRCHKDVVTKLREMRMIPEAIDHIVGHLIQENYLNEERFSKSFARGKFRIKKWGKIRITNELKVRNILKYNIQIALKEIDESEYLEVFDSLAKKRYRALKEPDLQKRKRKLADYLLYRGWESSLVYDKVKELVNTSSI